MFGSGQFVLSVAYAVLCFIAVAARTYDVSDLKLLMRYSIPYANKKMNE